MSYSRLWRSSDDRDAPDMQTMLVVAGCVALLLAALFWSLGNERSHWPVAQAKILSVEVTCQMTRQGGTWRRPRSEIVTIACDQVDRFLAENGGRNWRLNEFHRGDVAVTRAGKTVKLNIGLPGGAPRVGDTFEVIQNPDVPTEVGSPERNMAAVMMAAFASGVGVFLLAIAFFWF